MTKKMNIIQSSKPSLRRVIRLAEISTKLGTVSLSLVTADFFFNTLCLGFISKDVTAFLYHHFIHAARMWMRAKGRRWVRTLPGTREERQCVQFVSVFLLCVPLVLIYSFFPPWCFSFNLRYFAAFILLNEIVFLSLFFSESEMHCISSNHNISESSSHFLF
jgi:hypothetical protein